MESNSALIIVIRYKFRTVPRVISIADATILFSLCCRGSMRVGAASNARLILLSLNQPTIEQPAQHFFPVAGCLSARNIFSPPSTPLSIFVSPFEFVPFDGDLLSMIVNFSTMHIVNAFSKSNNLRGKDNNCFFRNVDRV